MGTVTSQASLTEYCYRELGAPLVEINITDEQANDRISEALGFFQDYYFDGIEKMLLKHLITQQNVTDGYIELPDNIFGVNRVWPASSSGNSETNIFDFQYQLRMNDLRDLTSTSMTYYSQVMQNFELLNYLLNTEKQFRWNKITGKLYIDQKWSVKALAGRYMLIECYSALDPATAPRFWNERLFKLYCTALFKRQWGQNIKKFGGITLPGGVTLDGQGMYEEGKSEAEDIERQIMDKLSPLEFSVG